MKRAVHSPLTMTIVAVLLRFLHIAAIAVVGAGTLFVRLGLGPPAPDADGRDAELVSRVAPAWRTAIWIALGAGVYNLAHLRPGPAPGLKAFYLAGLLLKLALVTGLFTIVFSLTAPRPRPWYWQRRRGLLTLGAALAGAVIALSSFLRSLR
jgi:hypothetical protein